MRQWICGLLFNHQPEHGEVEEIGEVFTFGIAGVPSHETLKAWVWSCLRCGCKTYGGEINSERIVP